MIKSMTGYGRAQATVDNMEITAEIRAVNHRYFEFSCRIPRQFGFLEDKLKTLVNKSVSRGKVEVYVSVNMLESEATDVIVNHPLAKAYVDALNELATAYGLRKELSVNDIARYPEVLTVRKSEEDEEKIYNAVAGVMNDAVAAFVKMREIEGERLKEDVISKCDNILAAVEIIEQKSAQTVVSYRERLEAKMRELLGDVNVEEQRLLTETAIFADKIAVDEETVRLKSHIGQLKTMMQGDEAVGRKLDFLVQEMNREANTTGSKSANVEITRIVVDIKSDIEKIREQIQNIE